MIIYDDEDNKEIFNSGTYIPQSYLQLYDSGAVEIRTPLSALVWTIVTPQEPGNSNHYSSTTTSSSSTAVTYKPGKLVYNPELNLFISEGLEGRLIATSDEFVNLSNKKKSKQKFHLQPDGKFTDTCKEYYLLAHTPKIGNHPLKKTKFIHSNLFSQRCFLL